MRSTSFVSAFASALAPLAIGVGLATVQVSAGAAEPVATNFNPHRFAVSTGVYRCELDRRVDVRQVSPDMQSAVLHFDKKEYKMQAVQARSGALRYEDSASGLVWLVIAGKSMLLDTKHGRQLANECRT